MTDPFLPYIDGLLFTMVRASHASIVLASDAALPRPEALTTDAGSRAYVANLPIDYDRLNADSVIGYLIGLSGKASDARDIDTTFHARIAGASGSTDVSFRFTMTTHGATRRFAIHLE